MITIGTDFSGVGSTNQALKRLGVEYKEVFACDMDKYARQTFIHNYGEPEYYPTDVYDREIPNEPLDLYVTTPPCQAFSLAGKRKGEEDKRGILFYNSHEFIQVNKPRYFCFENVKGLLSDDSGKTFARWCDLLGGKSVNGNPVIFPHDESVPYHIYFKVLNAKNYGIPQNRDRVFIIGIRDDEDNNFNWPVEIELEKRLKDVLETEVDKKYYLSDTMVNGFIGKNINEISNTIRCGGRGSKTEKHNWDLIQVKSATTKGYEIAQIGEDSINLEHPNSETRRGRVGKSVSQTLTTSCNQGVAINIVANLPGKHEQNSRIYGTDGVSPTLTTMQGGGQEPKISENYRIRKLTPRECFRLMDFPDSLLDIVNINNIINSQGILLYLYNKSILKWNVKEKTVKGKQLLKDYALCTTKDLENMEMKILNSNTHIEEIQNAQLNAVIEMFSQKECVQNITTLTENGEILYLVKDSKVRLVKEPDKELSNLMENLDLEEGASQNTDLLLKVTLEESFLKLNMFTISTMILQITSYLTYMFSLHKESIIYVTLNYKNFQKNFSDVELLNLKMGSTILSDSQLYKQAGNSVVVKMWELIFKKLFIK